MSWCVVLYNDRVFCRLSGKYFVYELHGNVRGARTYSRLEIPSKRSLLNPDESSRLNPNFYFHVLSLSFNDNYYDLTIHTLAGSFDSIIYLCRSLTMLLLLLRLSLCRLLWLVTCQFFFSFFLFNSRVIKVIVAYLCYLPPSVITDVWYPARVPMRSIWSVKVDATDSVIVSTTMGICPRLFDRFLF